jgi:hypothetical protein
MNEEQLQAYTNLPPAESCRLIDFDRAEIVVLESFLPQHVLTVTGTKPFLNMEVDLVPLVFVRQPEYRGIEVVGCLRGIGLPALAPYIVSMPLDGFVGTEGIEVIGATRSEKIEVASERSVSDCGDWSAVHDREPPGPAVLRVRGRCRFPVAGFSVELRRHEPQGSNPRDLLLDRIGHSPEGFPPPGTVVDVVDVDYREETEAEFDTVTILPDDVSVPVQVVS